MMSSEAGIEKAIAEATAPLRAKIESSRQMNQALRNTTAIEIARLRSENAALRQELDDERKDHGKMVEKYALLRARADALKAAASEFHDLATRGGYVSTSWIKSQQFVASRKTYDAATTPRAKETHDGNSADDLGDASGDCGGDPARVDHHAVGSDRCIAVAGGRDDGHHEGLGGVAPSPTDAAGEGSQHTGRRIGSRHPIASPTSNSVPPRMTKTPPSKPGRTRSASMTS